MKTLKTLILCTLALCFGIDSVPTDLSYLQAHELRNLEVQSIYILDSSFLHPLDAELPEYHPIETKKRVSLTDEEINLLARIAIAEAEAEPEEGIRLVIDTVLNRVDSLYFPNTVSEVIYQKNQYSPVSNGRLTRCESSEYFQNLVIEEAANRTNSEVIFFRTKRYSDYGVPMFKVCCHYFSSYAA